MPGEWRGTVWDMTSDLQAMNGDPLREVMNGILKHPGFEVAALAYVENVVAWRERLGLFNRVGTNLAFHVINYSLYLHLANRAGAKEHGATFSNLLAICEERKQCGARALRTVLALLQMTGQLHSERSSSDGRIQQYVPSDRLLDEAREIYGYAMQVLDSLLPGSTRAEQMRTDSEFISILVSRIGQAIIEDGVQITEHFPELHDIILKAGGLPTTISMAAAEMKEQPFPSMQAIAKKFKISPSQVRSVINTLSERGLVTRSVDGAIVSASLLVEQHKGLIARELALHVQYGFDLQEHFVGLGD